MKALTLTLATSSLIATSTLANENTPSSTSQVTNPNPDNQESRPIPEPATLLLSSFAIILLLKRGRSR